MKRKTLMAFCLALACLAFFEPMPAMASLPVPVETVTGCVKNGNMLIRDPEQFRHERPLRINPCSNIPFDFSGCDGKLIRATGGIDLYNGTFVCPTDMEIIGDCPSADETALQNKATHPGMLTEAEAEKIVWDLPEVKAFATRLNGTEVHPFTMITGKPDAKAKPGEPAAAYEVYVGEDQGTHTVRVMTFLVDAFDGKVSFYDAVMDRVIPIEEYRRQVKQ
jgi:hypothetical protein